MREDTHRLRGGRQIYKNREGGRGRREREREGRSGGDNDRSDEKVDATFRLIFKL